MKEFEEEIIDATPDKEDKKRKKSFGKGVLTGVLCTLLIFCLILGGTAIYLTRSLGGLGLEGFNLGKLKYITGLINYYYYEDVDAEALGEGVYKGVLEGLGDPYSVYYTESEYEDLMIDTTGNYAGIGAVLSKNVDTGEVTVVNVYEGAPAEKAGLQSGDVIVTADGYRGDGEELDSFVRHIRGEEGTKVIIEYEREGKTDVVEVTRAQVSVPSVTYEMLPGDIGYVALSEFSGNTKEQFDEAMADLQSQGMKAVVFDLRFNGGGLVDSVVEILDEILPEGITVYMEDKKGERTDYTSDGEHYLDMPIAVLTSENTASAAEIFAGAIRDFEYGTLIGTKTYGKGIVQTTVPLSDGSAIKITIASYYTPSGECIHKKGIQPDVELEYEFLGGDDEEYSTSLDNQIQKACEILRQEIK
ncbi:MAG: S41 family peptidase [Lachnospiraceae bacterium]|nr:S41 family peptidase [Lachnospiraceae bacterium]